MNAFYWFFVGIIFFSTLFLFYKKGWHPKSYSPWKIFGKVVSLAAIAGICYGGYLLACYCWPTPERLAFKELSKNLAEIELKPEKDKLAALGAKIKDGKRLTEAEKREAMEADEKIEKVRKDYSDGKLVTPSPKPASAKPKVTTKLGWVARLSADGEQIKDAALMELDQKANDKIEVDAKSPFSITDTEIKFSYKKRGKLHEALLTRENPQLEHYYGIIDLSDNTQLELWLKEDGLEKYKGNARQMIKRGREIIYAPLINAFLKKEEIVVSLGQ